MDIRNGKPFQGTATHATLAKVTKAAVVGKAHYLTDIAMSSDKAGAIVLVKSGTTVIWQAQLLATAVGLSIYNHTFKTPLKAVSGELLSVEVDGTAACKANMTGVSLNDKG